MPALAPRAEHACTTAALRTRAPRSATTRTRATFTSFPPKHCINLLNCGYATPQRYDKDESGQIEFNEFLLMFRNQLLVLKVRLC